MEPEWTKKIQSSTICNFFYGFYVVYLILFILSVVSTVGIFVYSKKLGAAGIAMAIQSLLITGFGATLTLFYYLICDRALLGAAVKDIQENFSVPPLPRSTH
jgi:hypothetical protein